LASAQPAAATHCLYRFEGITSTAGKIMLQISTGESICHFPKDVMSGWLVEVSWQPGRDV
jgi:hypothetical protein